MAKYMEAYWLLSEYCLFVKELEEMEKRQTIIRKFVLHISIPLAFDLLNLPNYSVNKIYGISEVAMFRKSMKK